MRTFEMAACGACMLVEDTGDHREIFGPDGECVRYFDTPKRMIKVLRELLDDREQRMRLRACVLERVGSGKHTYADRLRTMLATLRK
jgi:spore maturation protein CgeB